MNSLLKRYRDKSLMVLSIFCFLTVSLMAAPVYISNFSDFPAYPYNTTAYKQSNAFVGCGPTTGAMIFGYFDHINSLTVNGLLTNPVVGVDEGLNTAWVLHGSQYMNTGSNGFGSVYNIEPGLENYATDRGFQVKVVVHASPSYDPNSSASDWLNDYGAFGDSWLNDGYFWRNYSDGTWDIDASDFCDFVEDKLSAGVTIFLTIDTDEDRSGDHWVALVGFDRSTLRYAFYDTYSTSLQWADIHYCNATGATHDNAISFVRSVTYEGATTPEENPPNDLVALSGYHGRVPLAWNEPAEARRPVSVNKQIHEIHPPQADAVMFRQQKSIPGYTSILQSMLLEQPENRQIELPVVTALKGYNVYRSETSGGSYTKIASNVSRQYYLDESVSRVQTFYYKITAVYDSGESGFSNIANATPLTDGYTIEAGWADKTPNIDGLIKLDEWANAIKTNIAYPGSAKDIILYVMNDKQYLYLAVDDVTDNSLEDLDQFAFIFDENFDQEWPSLSPSGEGFIWTAWDKDEGKAFSVYGGRYGYWPDDIKLETNIIDPAGVTPGISIASGHVQYETRIDMSSSPLQTTKEYKIGILVFVYDYDPMYYNAFWPQEATKLDAITPNIYSWGTAPFSFGVLMTAGEDETTEPDIVVIPDDWDYGSISVGGFADKEFTIKNEGDASLNISDVQVTGDITQFSVTSGGESNTLAPGATEQLVVRFSPTSAGTKYLRIDVISNDPDENPYQVKMSGTGVVEENPVLSVTPLELDFGLDNSSMTFEISNSGNGTLSWDVVENPEKAWITNISPSSGSNTATVTVNVDRDQLAGESDDGILAVTSNGGNANVSVSIAKQSMTLPDHWQFSANTGNYATVVLPLTANPNIDGEPLQNGDYIGVFTPSALCCGWKQWQGENLSITVWGDNEQTPGIVDGFQAGERIYYRVLRLDANAEWGTVSVGYETGTGMYSANAFMVLNKFDVIEGFCMSVDFASGWNMFSINVEPEDPDIGVCMEPIVDQIVLIKSGTGQTFIPQYNINDIGDIAFDQGYQIYLNQNASLEFCGAWIDPGTSILLNAGWSMVSYLPTLPLNAATALASIADHLVIAKNNFGQVYIPLYNINDIGEMVPGQGYQLYLNAPESLVYPHGKMRKDKILHHAETTPPEHFEFVSNTGENATVVITYEKPPKYADGTLLQNGDEIGVLNSEQICCGAAVWEGANLAITVWGDNQQTEDPDGFIVGDTLRFCVWSKSENQEFMANVVFEEGSPNVYQVNGLSIVDELITRIDTDITSNMSTELPDRFELLPNYPNPFNPETYIIFDLPKACYVKISVYNIAGQLMEELAEELMVTGRHRIVWNALQYSTGIYLYRIQAGEYNATGKMVLAK